MKRLSTFKVLAEGMLCARRPAKERSSSQLSAQACSSAGEFLEATYREGLDLPPELSPQSYGRLVSRIFNDSGGAVSVLSADDGMVRLLNRSCPFSSWGRCYPLPCEIAATLMGGIAARNFGYAKLEFRANMLAGDPHCEYCLYTDLAHARDKPGEEFRHMNHGVVRQATSRPEPPLWPGGNPDEDLPPIVACSPQMRGVLRAIDAVAQTSATVLVTGETGVGKECVARMLHALSDRVCEPFVPVNCGAIPENLVESTLFGYERGAFTGAQERRQGLFERATHGTLFLDEIGTLSLDAQTRLLRVLQEGEYERVGGRQTLRARARIVAATNASLGQSVKAGRFRADLYYRINVVEIHIPPLRERREDIPALAEQVLRILCQRHGRPFAEITDRAMGQLMVHDWPGNVRELENTLERSLLFCPGVRIDEVILGPEHRESVAPAGKCTLPAAGAGWKDRKHRVLSELERASLDAALKAARGNVRQAAAALGLTPRAVYLRVKRQGIDLGLYRS